MRCSRSAASGTATAAAIVSGARSGGDFNRAALDQNLGLLDPVLLLDAAVEAQRLAYARHVRRGPACDILERTHAKMLEPLLDEVVDEPDTRQIVGRSVGGISVLGWRRGSLGSGRGRSRCQRDFGVARFTPRLERRL